MKTRFPGYYRPTEEEFRGLWDNCLFVPDTNILLHLFRYGEKTRAQVLDTFERLKPRIWVPYRAAHRRWREVDQSNRDAYDQLSDQIKAQGRSLSSLFEKYTRHQIIDVKQEQNLIDDFITQFCNRLSESKARHPAREVAEAIFINISTLIGDAVGLRPTAEEQEALLREGERRYESLTPPGYKDAKSKEGTDKYGDFFIWSEILEKAKKDQKPIVAITDAPLNAFIFLIDCAFIPHACARRKSKIISV
jgi:hypothetical protein